ncbi:MAG: hypothetical protein NVSMB39_7380 [Candidatus Saccharimonadales bacterium]
MAKKKNSQKKHTFKHSDAPEAAPAAAQGVSAAASTPAKPPLRAAVSGVVVRDFGYVAGDLKRIGIAATLLVAVELILFYVLTQTPTGAAIYNLVKI